MRSGYTRTCRSRWPRRCPAVFAGCAVLRPRQMAARSGMSVGGTRGKDGQCGQLLYRILPTITPGDQCRRAFRVMIDRNANLEHRRGTGTDRHHISQKNTDRDAEGRGSSERRRNIRGRGPRIDNRRTPRRTFRRTCGDNHMHEKRKLDPRYSMGAGIDFEESGVLRARCELGAGKELQSFSTLWRHLSPSYNVVPTAWSV